MDTKLKGDIAEQAVILKCLQLGFNVLTPIGDRLPYDLVIEKDSEFKSIQVKSAWYDKASANYLVDTRKSKTNRKVISHANYDNKSFDFAILFIQDLNIFYVMPVDVFNSYSGSLCLVTDEKRQRKPKSHGYLEAWNLLDT